MAQWALFWGSMLTAFAPITCLFMVVVAKRAQLVILTITAAFFYLLGLLVSATLWSIIPPLHDSIQATIPVSIIIQEIFRYAFFQVYIRSEQAVKRVTTKQNQLPLNDLTSFRMTGEGAAFTSTCPQLPLVYASALSTLALSLMDVALMVLAFEGYRKRSPGHIAAVVLIHLGSGLSNLVNLNEVGCQASIPLTYVAALLAVVAAIISVKRASSFA
ncbi:hypothetical protein Ae201684P_003340 [Aphanomyces euteiches]|nr:hypothetical protein Ae201684P_003340 [Aphanomyces euteiches]